MSGNNKNKAALDTFLAASHSFRVLHMGRAILLGLLALLASAAVSATINTDGVPQTKYLIQGQALNEVLHTAALKRLDCKQLICRLQRQDLGGEYSRSSAAAASLTTSDCNSPQLTLTPGAYMVQSLCISAAPTDRMQPMWFGRLVVLAELQV